MKIGILTFHRAVNYGAVLQAYALQEYLRQKGHDVYILDYKPDYMQERYALHSLKHWVGRSLGTTIYKILTEPFLIANREKRYKNFQEFVENYLRLSEKCDLSQLNDFDALVFGSDQIWQPSLTGGAFDPTYFGQGFSGKKLSYAASSRISSLSESDIEFLKEKLNSMNYIGVREPRLKELLQPLVEREISINLDPTLLAGKAWIDGITTKRMVNDEYCLIYEIQRHKKVRNAAKKYSSRSNSKCVEIMANDTLSFSGGGINTASPEVFLSYIKYAKCVFTTSFHGTALSILQEKDFYYFRQHNNSDERIENLLSQLNLEDRILEMGVTPVEKPIDYKVVNALFQKAQVDSGKYLENALDS